MMDAKQLAVNYFTLFSSPSCIGSRLERDKLASLHTLVAKNQRWVKSIAAFCCCWQYILFTRECRNLREKLPCALSQGSEMLLASLEN
jgi:hypothetical protein